jgi:hypothetical protein
VKELRATPNYGPSWELREIRKEGVGVQKRFKFPLFLFASLCLAICLGATDPKASLLSVTKVSITHHDNAVKFLSY